MATQPFILLCLLWIASSNVSSAYGDEIQQVALSPFRIEAYVRSHGTFRARDLWKALGLPELVSDPNLPRDRAGNFDCKPDSPCQVWLEPVQLSWDTTRFIALRFTQSNTELNRYLVFGDKGNAWKLVGYIDAGFAKYFDPTLNLKEVGGKWWLVLREQSGSGTGYRASIQRWFEMRDRQLYEALSLPDQAYHLDYPGRYVRRPSAIVTDFERTIGGDLVRVLLRIAFTLVDDEGVDRAFLGSVERTIVYKRNRNEIAFHLDPADGASQSDIESIFRPPFGSDSATDFLREDLQHLLRIAMGPESVERKWLLRNIKDFPPSSERQELMRALAAKAAQ